MEENDIFLFNEKFTQESQQMRNYLNDLWQEKKFCDLTLKTRDGKYFQVHKNILFASSRFFHGLFASSWGETNNDIIELDKNVHSEELALILEYIYTGCIDKKKVNFNSAVKLHTLATFFRMDILQDLIQKYLINTIAENLVLWRNAVDLLINRDAAEEFIKQNCGAFLDCHLLDLNAAELKAILSFNNLEISQEDLMSNVLKWIKADFNEREKFIKDFMQYIKIEEISSDYLNQNIITDEILFENKCILQYIVKEQNSIPEKKNSFSDIEVAYFLKAQEKQSPWLIDQFSFNEIDMVEKKIVQIYDWKKQRKGYSVTKFKQNNFFFTGPKKVCEYFSNYEFHPLPSMLEERSWHSSININNTIYCCGGTDYLSDTCEVFDLNYMKWVKRSSMNDARYDFSLIEHDGVLYAIGGHRDFDSSIIEQYDPRTDKWINFPVMANGTDFEDGTRGIVHKNKMFIANGDYDETIFQLEFKNNSFEISKTYSVPEMEIWCGFLDLFIYQDELYFFQRGGEKDISYCFKLNENTENFELFNDKLSWRVPRGNESDMFFIL